MRTEVGTSDRVQGAWRTVSTAPFPTCVSGSGCTGGPGGTFTTAAYEDGLLKSITANGGGFLLSSITYHPSGMPNVITHSSAGSMIETITQAANGMARPNSITITAPSDMTPFTTGTYAYDAAGNIKTMGTDHFRYDRYSRLAEAQMQSIVPARTQSYGFDAYGNMTSVATTSGPTETFQVIGTSNRITLPAPVALAQYDTGGNLTSWSDPTTTSTYTWDRFNRLNRWSNGAEGWSYVYTADDERLWAIKDVAGATYSNWTLRGLGNEVLFRDERRPSPTPRTMTQYAYREGKLYVSLEVGGPFRDHGLDHLGSIRAIADISVGTLSVRHTYFPFGREATSTGQDDEVMKFTGHERDLQSTTINTVDDLDYMHARYRSPLTSRFLSTDPVGGDPSSPQSWNRYAYVVGNPLNRTDPDGKLGVLALAGLGALAGGGIEYLAQVGVNMAQRTTGPIHAFDQNISGGKILASAGLGALTGGISNTVKGAGAVVRIGVAAAANVGEAGAHAAIDGVPLTGQAARSAALTGGGFSIASMMGKVGARLLKPGQTALRELADTARRLGNIASEGRPRMSQSMRAEAAQQLLQDYGGGQYNDLITDSLRKTADTVRAHQ